MNTGIGVHTMMNDEVKPITWKGRFTETLTLLCGGEEPPEKLVDEWINHTSDDLQDWVGTSGCPWWLQCIGAIDAAHSAANQPIEGFNEELEEVHINKKLHRGVRMTKTLPSEDGLYYWAHSPRYDPIILKVWGDTEGQFWFAQYPPSHPEMVCSSVEDLGGHWARVEQDLFEFSEE